MFEHAESIIAVVGALVTFASWNISQGIRLKSAEAEIAETKKSLGELRIQQDTMVKPLYDELRRIGEKLAHIEGFLTAKKQSEG
jgi:hypothetical protein